MTDRIETPIRTRADGSIDTGFYMARGRAARSRAAHAGGAGFWRWLRLGFRAPRRPEWILDGRLVSW